MVGAVSLSRDDVFVPTFIFSCNVVVLSPGIAKVFRTSESVNEALRTLVRVGRKPSRKLSA